MRVGVVAYGMGNIGSVQRAISELGADCVMVDSPSGLGSCDRIVLPGVGSFTKAMQSLAEHGWQSAITHEVKEKRKPLLGICLGMQLLATRGTEHGDTAGLDLIPGEIVSLVSSGCPLRVPHVGWNELTAVTDHPLFAGIPVGTDFYFVHSFAFRGPTEAHVIARCSYGIPVAAAIGLGNVMGTQYHPEKSSRAGFRQLRNFLEWEPC